MAEGNGLLNRRSGFLEPGVRIPLSPPASNPRKTPPTVRRAFLLLLALAAACARAEPFRFIQISDTHQGRAIHQWRYRQAIRQINELPFDVDVVVHTGDIVSAGFKSHDVAGAASNLFAQIRWPRICCPGNHDLRFDRATDAWTNRYYRAASVYQVFFGPLAQSWETTNALYLAIDTEEIRQAGAPRLPGFDPLAWLEERLSAAPPDKPVFVFTHVPDCDDYFRGVYTPGWTNEKGLADWRALLARHPQVKAVIAGHFHRNARVEHSDGGPPTVIASSLAAFWDRQASYRVYSYEDGCLSYQDAYIQDPPPGTHISYEGFVVEDAPATNAPGAAAP